MSLPTGVNVLLPRSLEEALGCAASAQGPLFYLAGGSDLAIQLAAGRIRPGGIVRLWGLAELRGIDVAGDKLRIGACETMGAILASGAVRRHAPFLAESLELFASPQIRSVATVGGNICNGSPTADTVPPLLVLGAEVELQSVAGMRRVSLEEFYTGYKKNVLGKGEIVRAVVLPLDGLAGCVTFYRKVASRRTLTIAKVSVAAAYRTQAAGGGRQVSAAAIAVGSMHEYPRRLARTEALIRSAPAGELDPGEVADTVLGEITPISDFRSDERYRAQVCVNLVLASLQSLGHGMRESEPGPRS